MDAHVDWLSFTMPVEAEPFTASHLYDQAHVLLRMESDELERIIFDGNKMDVTTGRAPYRLALSSDDGGLRIYGQSHTSTILYECTGRWCERRRSGDGVRRVCGQLHDRISRLDFAVDIPCDTLPANFANARSHNAFRTISFIRSDTGETAYVGSPKSDRFCRVYRYNHPHPRSHLLRIEFVFRRGLAREAALRLAQAGGYAQFVAELGNTWGWTHKVWQPEVETDERVRTPILAKHDEDTVAWLYKQVAPAIKRLMAESNFDIVEWLEFVYKQ